MKLAVWLVVIFICAVHAQQDGSGEAAVDNALNAIDEKLTAIGSKLNAMEDTLGGMDNNIGGVNDQLHVMDGSMNQMSNRLSQSLSLQQLQLTGIPTDCPDVQTLGNSLDGVYSVQPAGAKHSFDVYCQLAGLSVGWTVFQRRHNGSVDFYRNWTDYKNGFGNLEGEFWLGNDKIYQLTNQFRRYELRVDLEDWEGGRRYALYDNFKISDEPEKYRLTLGSYSGTAGDSLSRHRGHDFTTKDNDNDIWTFNCAEYRTGAWWYADCSDSNLNGRYLGADNSVEFEGAYWEAWKGTYYSYKNVEIKMRPSA